MRLSCVPLQHQRWKVHLTRSSEANHILLFPGDILVITSKSHVPRYTIHVRFFQPTLNYTGWTTSGIVYADAESQTSSLSFHHCRRATR